MMPQQIAIAIDDLVDNCGNVQPGQHVLIVAANDGLYGGVNIVDEPTVNWIQAAVQQRGAHASVLWLDMPTRPAVIWNEGGKPVAWRIPPVLKGALSGADVFINLCVDLSFEEELKEIADICREHEVPMVRNMATTAPLLASAWGQTPYELVSEIRFQTASLLQPGAHWTLTHPNGTHLEGTIGTAASASAYASRRTEGLYRPFPEGVFPAATTKDAEGTLVFEGTNPIWARHIGVPSKFEAPIELTIKNGFIREFRGGSDADRWRGCYAAMSKVLGEEAYRIRGTHGGVHPYARVSERQCPDDDYRNFIEHHHWSSQHVHLGNSHGNDDFPYNMHVTAEIRGATLQVGDKYLWKDGRLTALDHPAVKAIAAKYPGRPGLDADLWN
jgi:leucyl aminopeptidase (aminopeptidase T)